MKAIIKRKPIKGQEWSKGFELVEKPEPNIKDPGEVKLKVLAAAVCGTDVGIYLSKDSLNNEMVKMRGDDVIVGHEFCGQLEEAGEIAKKHLAKLLLKHSYNNLKLLDFIKDRTIEEISNDNNLLKHLQNNFIFSAEMHITCNTCYQCNLGQKHVCKNTIIKGIHEDGIFTSYVVVPAENLVLFEKGEIPIEIISFMDALGNATHTVQSVPIAGQNLLILGGGIQGLAACAIARQLGANKIFLTDVSNEAQGLTPQKLEDFKFKTAYGLGADYCFDMATEEGREKFSKVIKEETGNVGVDVVYEMSGSYLAYKNAFEAVRMGGTISLLGLPAGELSVNFAKDVIFKGVTIKGIIGRRVFDTWDLMRSLLTSGLTDLLIKNNIITHELPLDRFEEGFQAHFNGEACKVILKP